ncbi:MAG: GAF domain-containing protein, partial [Comamonadaceae bacterium]
PARCARVRALRASGALDDERLQALFALTSKRAADIFDVPLAMVSLIDEHVQVVRGAHGSLPGVSSASGDLDMAREISMCGHVVANAEMLVVPDLARDPRFAGNAALRGKGLRFYAGAPLRDAEGHVLGSLCILDVVPRELDARERRLLQAMADDLMEVARGADSQLGAIDLRERTDAADAPVQPPSATVGQPVPT